MNEKVKKPTDGAIDDAEIKRLRDVVLKWVDAKNKKDSKKGRLLTKLSLKKEKEKQLEAIEKVKLTPINSTPKKKKEVTPVAIPKVTTPAPVKKVKEEKIKPVKNIKKPKKKGSVKKYFIWLISLIVIAFIVFTVNLYFLGYSSAFNKKVVKIIPFPIAFVDFTPLYYGDLVNQADSLMKFYENEKKSNPTLEIPTEISTQNHILDRMIEKQLIKKIAEGYNVQVTQEEIDSEINSLITEIGSQEALESQLDRLYGWTVEEFGVEIIHSLLLRNKVSFAVIIDDRINQEARSRAQEIADEVKINPDTFTDVAKQKSEDITAARGGDLGYFGPGQMVPDFEIATFALEPGQVSDLVKSPFGYHIIKLEEKITDEEGNIEQVKASHILIRGKDLTKYIEEIKAETKIIRLLQQS